MGEGIGQLAKVIVVVLGILLVPEAGLLVFCASQVLVPGVVGSTASDSL